MTFSVTVDLNDNSFQSSLKGYVQEFIIALSNESSMYRPQTMINQLYIDSINQLKIYDFDDKDDFQKFNTQCVPLFDSLDIFESDSNNNIKPFLAVYTIVSNSTVFDNIRPQYLYVSDSSDPYFTEGFLVITSNAAVIANDFNIASAVSSYFMNHLDPRISVKIDY